MLVSYGSNTGDSGDSNVWAIIYLYWKKKFVQTLLSPESPQSPVLDLSYANILWIQYKLLLINIIGIINCNIN
jgi:hypothetical protein